MPTDSDALPAADEAALVVAAQAGDRRAFGRLVEAHWDRLHRWLFHLARDRHRAEDLTQETFLKALAALGSFRPGTNFRAWLFRIGHNNFVNLKRAGKRAPQPLPDDAPSRPGPTAEAAASDRETVRRVQQAIAELAPDFRAALLLRAEEGLSFKEVADILGTTEETARWRVFKARQRLVNVLAPELLPPGVGDS